MKRLHLVGLALLCFASPAIAGKHYVTNGLPPMAMVHYPALDEVSAVEIGESMVFTAYKGVRPIIRLSEPITNVKIGVSFLSYLVSIPPGNYTMYDTNAAGTFYAAPAATIAGVGESYVGMILVPKDPTKPTEACIRSDTFVKCEVATLPANSITLEPTGVDVFTPQSYKKELVYAGVAQNVVTLLYREFMNDMARPAFSQELKYDISQDDVIGYKGARFQVLKAGNTLIKFKTLKHLNQ